MSHFFGISAARFEWWRSADHSHGAAKQIKIQLSCPLDSFRSRFLRALHLITMLSRSLILGLLALLPSTTSQELPTQDELPQLKLDWGVWNASIYPKDPNVQSHLTLLMHTS